MKRRITASGIIAASLPWCVALLLAACAQDPSDTADERLALAQQEDAIANCGLVVEQPGFEAEMEECRVFAEKDEECAIFPGEKEGCQAFLHSPAYPDLRLHCKNFNFVVKNCQDRVTKMRKPPALLAPLVERFGEQRDEDDWIKVVREIEDDLVIGVVDSGYAGKEPFLDGLKLAVEEVNNDQGVLGRKIRLRIEETDGDLDQSRSIAKEMAADLDVRVVIGRQFSVNTVPVVPVYESANIVYITVSSVMRNVIRHGSRYTFRLVPNSEALARGLATYAVSRGYKRIAVLYSRDNYNEEMAYAFRDFAVGQGMTIVYEKSFFETRTNFADIGAEMLEKGIDAVFLSTFVGPATRLVHRLRGMGLDAPILGSDALDSNAFAASVGEAGTGIVVPTIYNPFSKSPENAAFVEKFRQQYGYLPAIRAAQGYDVIKLLAYTMQQEARSTVPSSIATTLRHMAAKQGAVGDWRFGDDGELADPVIYIAELQNGEFVLFKDRHQEEERSRALNIVNGKLIHRPGKPAESTEALGIQ